MACSARLLRVMVGKTENLISRLCTHSFISAYFVWATDSEARLRFSDLQGLCSCSIAMTRDIAKREPLLPPEPAIRNVLSGCSATLLRLQLRDRKSTRLNSSHSQISYAVFCLKKKITERSAKIRACVAGGACRARARLPPFRNRGATASHGSCRALPTSHQAFMQRHVAL